MVRERGGGGRRRLELAGVELRGALCLSICASGRSRQGAYVGEK